MSEAADPLAQAYAGQRERQEGQELTDLLQFFYQCPVGLFEISDTGTVRMVNPAAVQLLAPVIGGDELSTLFPLLGRLAPQLVDLITANRGQLGPLAAGQRILVPLGASGSPADPRGPGGSVVKGSAVNGSAVNGSAVKGSAVNGSAVNGSAADDACLEMQAVRVAPDRVMIVVQDVSSEHRLALREREIAVELQLAMLGRADEVPGLAVGVTYRAADAELAVGGDWYDVIALPGGLAGLVVGDIVGHNLAATGAMGQLRSALRATAQYRPEPAELLSLGDQIARRIDGATSATVAYGLLDLGSGVLRYASAGHPPILVIGADGHARYLDGGRGLPLGVVSPQVPRSAGHVQLWPGDTAVLFTDGLYERRDEVLDERLGELIRLAPEFRHLSPTEMSRRLTDAMLCGRPAEDDICVLVATIE